MLPGVRYRRRCRKSKYGRNDRHAAMGYIEPANLDPPPLLALPNLPVHRWRDRQRVPDVREL